ncbi:MAG: hypothetical protein F6K48_07040 [Okeania sp. SIO3H1]|nr:hypothetical protein [Okeania sp. SIO3H1]
MNGSETQQNFTGCKRMISRDGIKESPLVNSGKVWDVLVLGYAIANPTYKIGNRN